MCFRHATGFSRNHFLNYRSPSQVGATGLTAVRGTKKSGNSKRFLNQLHNEFEVFLAVLTGVAILMQKGVMSG